MAPSLVQAGPHPGPGWALSLVQQGQGRWVLVDEDFYAPIYQALAVVKTTKRPSEARGFVTFVNTPRAQSILHKYGFLPPPGALPL